MSPASLPNLNIRDYDLFAEKVPNGVLTLQHFYVTVEDEEVKSFQGAEAAQIKDVKLGFFRNQKLLAWATPCEKPDNYHGFKGENFYRFPDMTVENLTAGDKLAVAALVTDSYGRQFMACDVPYVVEFDTDRDAPFLTHPSDGRYDSDPDNWSF